MVGGITIMTSHQLMYGLEPTSTKEDSTRIAGIGAEISTIQE